MFCTTRRHEFFTAVYQPAKANDEQLYERWRECGLSVPGYEKALASLQAERTFVYEANQPLEAQEQELMGQFNQLIG